MSLLPRTSARATDLNTMAVGTSGAAAHTTCVNNSSGPARCRGVMVSWLSLMRCAPACPTVPVVITWIGQ